MSSLKRITVLEDLPTELFFQIFDFLSFVELQNTFCHLNRRIDDYLTQLPNIHLLLSLKHLSNIQLNDQQLLHVKSISFPRFVEEDSDEIQKFFIQYPLKLFQRLRSLRIYSIISTIDIDVIINPLPFLPNITHLTIMVNLFPEKLTINDLQHTINIIFCSCVTLNKLAFIIMDDLDLRKRIHNAPVFNQLKPNNIEYLNIFKLYFNEFNSILSPLVFPRLKSLCATIHENLQQRNFPNDGLSFNVLVYLSLTFEWYATFERLESIFKQTSSLKTLVLSCSTIKLIDCQKWQYFLSKYLLKLVKFHLHGIDWDEVNWSERNEYTSFLTSTFWSDERGGVIQTNCQQVLDEEGSEVDSIFVHFTTMAFKYWKKQCSCCLRYQPTR